MQDKSKEIRLSTLQFRLERTASRLITLRQIENRFPWYRLAALVLGLLATYLGFQLLPFFLAWAVLLAALVVFVLITLQHKRVIDRTRLLEVFQHILETHIARINLDWKHIPPSPGISSSPDHPFAPDLNISGDRSLHQLLDTTVSMGGSQQLASWLLDPVPDPEQISTRQRLVQELLGHPTFRMRLELNGWLASPKQGERWDGSALLKWLNNRHPTGSLRTVLIALFILSAANIILFVLNTIGSLPPFWIGTFIVYFALQSLKFRETSEVFGEAYTLAQQLHQLRIVLADLETFPYRQNEKLTALCTPFFKGPIRPFTALRQISGIASAASLRNNPFLSLALNILVPWDLFFAYQLERYKQMLGEVLPTWLNTWYHVETLSALANFANFNPKNTFPEIIPLDREPILNGSGIGHPLIPENERVNNDFSMQRLGEIAIITGSNMSGKSTFLRTLGINLVLAYAGSTVSAQNLATLPFRLFTSMNLNDSLSDGISFFYAEVRRLKALLNQLEAPHPLPSFFLIDEIFRGTNNRERQLGSRAYMQALSGKYGAGLISTHDLELVHLADTFSAVQNYHFREDIQDNQMVFDFKIRSGSSPTTNALRIMALAGLPVPVENKNP